MRCRAVGRYTGRDANGGDKLSKADMHVNIAGVELRSPVIAASGTFGYGLEFEEIVSLDRIGAFVTKGLSREPMAGNASPRIIESPAGMMNAVGPAEHRRSRLRRREAAQAARDPRRGGASPTSSAIPSRTAWR